MDWANLGLPCLLVRPLTNLQFKEGLRIPYTLISLYFLFVVFIFGQKTSQGLLLCRGLTGRISHFTFGARNIGLLGVLV